MSWLAAGSVIADFRIEGVVGRGGMGVVYRAVQLSLERPVALKLIAPALTADPGFRARFERESRLAASLDHPNVVPVYAAGEDAGVLYIAMRFVDGTDLRTLIRTEGRLAPERAARIIAQVGSALDAAHHEGLVHRDVKPANILLSQRGGEEHVYLTDFGLTKRSASSGGLTGSGEWVGTLDYVAPEQLRGERVDGRADVYSLGCVLYEGLSGQVPYPRENDLAKLWAHISDPAPSASEVAPDVPPGLTRVVQTAMAKARDERYGSAGALGRAAVAAAPDVTSAPTRPVAATLQSPPGRAEARPARPRRRRSSILVAAGVLVGGLVAGALLLLQGDGDEDRHAAMRSTAARTAAPPPPAGPLPVGPAVGRLVQLPGGAGCIVGEAVAGCARSRGFRGAGDVAVTPDGRFAYVASTGSGAVAVFAREDGRGALRQLRGQRGCVRDRASSGCALARGLSGPSSVAVSPDGRNVYVAASGSQAVGVFTRNPRTGALRQLFGSSGCVSRARGDGCTTGRSLPRPRDVVVSADGANVYVAGEGGVAAFSRSVSQGGALTQLAGRAGCVSHRGNGCTIVSGVADAVDLVESPSGRQLYVASADADRLAVVERADDGSLAKPTQPARCLVEAPGAGGCEAVRALRNPRAVVISPDGANVYVASQESDAIAVFRRDDASGALRQPAGAAGCVIQAGGGGCAEARALDGVKDLAISPNGRNLYAVSPKINTISLFSRNVRRGLRRLPGSRGCFIRGGVLGCSVGRGLTHADGITISPDGRNAYVASEHPELGGIAVFRRLRD
jgi:DNA-binding beta-propeller fold protein YncE